MVQHRHKVRVCVSVVHLLADEIENLGGALSVYMYLGKGRKNMSSQSSNVLQTDSLGFSSPYRFEAVGQSQLVLVPQHLKIV